MIRLTIVIGFSLIQQLLLGQTNVMEYDNLKTLNLKGKVKTIKEISYRAAEVNSKVVKLLKGWKYNWQHDMLYSFDTLGNLVSLKEEINSNQIDNYSIKLDSKNRIIEVNRLVRTNYYQYDSLNRIYSSIIIYKDPETNSNGNLNAANEYETKEYYYYDSKNRLSKKERFENKIKTFVETFQYDSHNNLILCQIKKGALIESHKYVYDANNLLTKYEWGDNEDGVFEITINEYLNQNKVKERWELYIDNELEGYIDTKFENGNIVETKEIEIDGTVSGTETVTYEFDENGNWIKSVTKYSDGALFMIERTIDYY